MLLRRLAIALALVATTSVYAQQASNSPMSAAEVLKQAQHSASDVEQLRAALQSPDPSTRISTMNAMLNSHNPALINMAIDMGNASSDVNLRNLAVRAAFAEVTSFTPQPVTPLSNDAERLYSEFAGETGGIKINITGYNLSHGYFQGNGSLRGQISYGRLAFQTLYCNAVLLSKGGSWRFQGRVDCQFNSDNFSEMLWVQIR